MVLSVKKIKIWVLKLLVFKFINKNISFFNKMCNDCIFLGSKAILGYEAQKYVNIACFCEWESIHFILQE
jgi:hypothetical protein